MSTPLRVRLDPAKDALTNNRIEPIIPSPALREKVASLSEPDDEARKRPRTSQAARPSPSHFVGPSLSRGAGEGIFGALIATQILDRIKPRLVAQHIDRAPRLVEKRVRRGVRHRVGGGLDAVDQMAEEDAHDVIDAGF